MDLEKFHQLYNFRKRSPEELEALQKLNTYSSSSSRSSSSSSVSSCCSSCCSSRPSTRSRSRSLPYSIPSSPSRSPSSRCSSSQSSSRSSSRSSRVTSGYLSEDTKDYIEAVDALLEAPFTQKRASKRKSTYAKRRSKRSRSRSPDRPDHAILATQLPSHICRKDIDAFFSKVGKIKDILLLFCPVKKTFKGMARVEFCNIESVILALGLNGNTFKGSTVVIQPCTRDQILLEDALMTPMTLKLESKEIIQRDSVAAFSSFGKLNNVEIKGTEAFVTFKRSIHALEALHELTSSLLDVKITII